MPAARASSSTVTSLNELVFSSSTSASRTARWTSSRLRRCATDAALSSTLELRQEVGGDLRGAGRVLACAVERRPVGRPCVDVDCVLALREPAQVDLRGEPPAATLPNGGDRRR